MKLPEFQLDLGGFNAVPEPGACSLLPAARVVDMLHGLSRWLRSVQVERIFPGSGMLVVVK